MTTFDFVRSRALLVLLLLALALSGCASSEVAQQTRPTCAQSAVHAYRSGDFACAERLLPFLSNAATRHEVLAYMFLKTGRVKKGLPHLSTAISLLDSAPGDFQNDHARQAKRLRAVRDRFAAAVAALSPSRAPDTTRQPDSLATVSAPADTSETPTAGGEGDDRRW